MEFFFFQVFPYVALTILILGSIARYERDPFSWKSKSSQFLRRRQLIWGSILFHVGILIVFIGHLVGLLTPIELFDTIGVSHGVKQFMAIFVGGIAGIMAVVGGAMLLHRRLTDPRIRATSTFADTGILALLLLQLIIGLGTIIVSLDHLDGGAMVQFMNYSRAIFTFQTDAWLQIVDAHWIFKLHMALGLFIFILFPFTRLVHMLSVPVRYLWRPGYQIVRSRSTAERPVGELRPSAPQPASHIPAVRPGTKISQPHSTPAE
jgi:nitrate reductase gamma subunit